MTAASIATHTIAVALGMVLAVSWPIGSERDSTAKRTEATKLIADGFTLATELAHVTAPPKLQGEAEKLKGTIVAARNITTCPVPATRAVAAGEKLRLHIDETDVRTPHGNQVTLAEASILDDSGQEIAHAAIDPTQSSVSVTRERDANVTRGWGFGPAITLSSRGFAYGATVAAPPLVLFSMQISPVATATFGQNVTGVTFAAAISR